MFSGIRSANAHQLVKFYQNRSNGLGDIVIFILFFLFLKMAVDAILDLQKKSNS